MSWSGNRSKGLANALREWLPLVLQYVEPWVSDKDIAAGDRWAQALTEKLESSNFGIICVTPENIGSEWLLFEAGALSKSMLDGKVIPLLFGLELSDLGGPLSQFQAQKMERAGMMEVVRAINKVADKGASEQIIEQLVPTLWPRLAASLESIPDTPVSQRHTRPQHEVLEELVTGIRGINAQLHGFDHEIPEKLLYYPRRRGRFHPRLLKSVFLMSRDLDDPPLALVLLAGFLREDFPWLAELLSDGYRQIKEGKPDDAEESLHRLGRVIETLAHHPLMRDLPGDSKDARVIAECLPELLDDLLRDTTERVGLGGRAAFNEMHG